MSLKRTLMNALSDQFLDRVQVAEVNAVTENFRFIDLESEAFKTLDLKPGVKLQLDVGDWNFRTYTPVTLDRELGRIGILAYVHGGGPGSQWVANARPGDALHFFGPRRSLKLPESNDPLIIFGDETTIAVAASIQRLRGRKVSKMVFEATNPDEIARIVSDMGLENVEIFKKSEDGILPLPAIEAVVKGARSPHQLLLTGRAESIRQMRQCLREEGIPMSRVTTKAYWAVGKRGLD